MLKPKAILMLLLAAPVFLSGCFVVRPPCVMDDDLEHCRTLALAPEENQCQNPECRAPLSTDTAAAGRRREPAPRLGLVAGGSD